MPLKKGLKSLRKLVEIVDASSKDASRARKVSRSPKMQQEISADRRTALAGNFKTVRQAISDRDRIAGQKAKAKKKR
jgi:hypothetical protein